MKNYNDIKQYELCILYSSGIDSITGYYYAIKQLKIKPENILLLMINYGQSYHEKEKFLFENFLKDNPKVNYKCLDINIENESDLEYHYVSNRNVILSSIGFRFSDEVWLCANADEQHVKDKDMDFFTLSTQLNSHTLGKPVILFSPFLNWSREKILRWGIGNNVPYNFSSSCYHEILMQCGECKGCIDRYFDFMDLGIIEEFEKNILEYPRVIGLVEYLHLKDKTPEEQKVFEKYIRVLQKTKTGKEIIKCIM